MCLRLLIFFPKNCVFVLSKCPVQNPREVTRQSVTCISKGRSTCSTEIFLSNSNNLDADKLPNYPTSHLQICFSVRERRAQNGLMMKRLTEQFINVIQLKALISRCPVHTGLNLQKNRLYRR